MLGSKMTSTSWRPTASKLNGKTPDALAALGYDSALVLADAINARGTTDGQKFATPSPPPRISTA